MGTDGGAEVRSEVKSGLAESPTRSGWGKTRPDADWPGGRLYQAARSPIDLHARFLEQTERGKAP